MDDRELDVLETMASDLGITDLTGTFLASLVVLDGERRAVQVATAREIARIPSPLGEAHRRLNLAAAGRCAALLRGLLSDEERR